MNIYIDFDDVICETARNFCELAEKLFNIQKPYEEINFFNLQKSFELDDAQYDQLMLEGHKPEVLLSYLETKDASLVINSWVDKGYNVKIITGRPFSAYEPSRKWLDIHGLQRLPLYHVDKYGRENFNKNSTYSMTLEDLYNMDFDIAIEDSPAAFTHLEHFNNCKVCVFNRPWNANCNLPSEHYTRYNSWLDIEKGLGI